jgi:hypothetical protein
MTSRAPQASDRNITRTTEDGMGHQVNFYLDAHDTKQIEAVVRSVRPMLVLHSRSPQPEPKLLDSLSHDEQGQTWLFYRLVLPEDLGAVVMEHVPAQGYWTVDVLKSPVIQFNRCYFDGTILRRGRLYYVDGFYDINQRWEVKSESFRKWAKAVFAKTKKALKKHETDYIGTGAASWLASSGGKLVL